MKFKRIFTSIIAFVMLLVGAKKRIQNHKSKNSICKMAMTASALTLIAATAK